MNFPKDPVMLLSVINTYLRDKYPSLDKLCAEEGLDRAELEQTLAAIDYHYMEQINQFR